MNLSAPDNGKPLETPEVLEEVGWKRVAKRFYRRFPGHGIMEEGDIMADLIGELWWVSSRYIQGDEALTITEVHRTHISRSMACAMVAGEVIPEELQPDFRECEPPVNRFEEAVLQQRIISIVIDVAVGKKTLKDFTLDEIDVFQSGVRTIAERVNKEVSDAWELIDELGGIYSPEIKSRVMASLKGVVLKPSEFQNKQDLLPGDS